MNMIEDEIHFLVQCPCYDHIRIPLFKKISAKHHDFKNMSQQEQFIFIMSSKDIQIIKWLAKSLYCMFSIRIDNP